MTLVVLQTMVLLAVSPFIVGLIRKVKATLQGRRGASVVQPHYDLLKLFQKDVVVSSNASWIFTATPYILFASTLAANKPLLSGRNADSVTAFPHIVLSRRRCLIHTLWTDCGSNG